MGLQSRSPLKKVPSGKIDYHKKQQAKYLCLDFVFLTPFTCYEYVSKYCIQETVVMGDTKKHDTQVIGLILSPLQTFKHLLNRSSECLRPRPTGFLIWPFGGLHMWVLMRLLLIPVQVNRASLLDPLHCKVNTSNIVISHIINHLLQTNHI